jgi:hypothetical protein
LNEALVLIARAQEVNEALHFRHLFGRKIFELVEKRLLIPVVHGHSSLVAVLPACH